MNRLEYVLKVNMHFQSQYLTFFLMDAIKNNSCDQFLIFYLKKN